MDFSAWFEVFLDDRWWTFDARHNAPRIGRVLIATGPRCHGRRDLDLVRSARSWRTSRSSPTRLADLSDQIRWVGSDLPRILMTCLYLTRWSATSS